MAILVAVDGETAPDPVVSVGYDLANAYGDELVVMHVMPEEVFEGRREDDTDRRSLSVALAPGVDYSRSHEVEHGTSSSDSRYTIDEHGEPDAAAVARAVVDRTLDDHADISVQGRVGEPTQEIIAEADRRDARYLVVGGRKRSPVGKAVFGSITQSLLLNAERPIMTVMSEGEE